MTPSTARLARLVVETRLRQFARVAHQGRSLILSTDQAQDLQDAWAVLDADARFELVRQACRQAPGPIAAETLGEALARSLADALDEPEAP